MFAMNNNQTRRGNRTAPAGGFTLMEVLLVLVILVVLASLAVNMFTGTQEKAEKDAAAAEVGLIKRGIEMYRFHTRQYPGDLQELVTKPSDAKLADRWGGPYLDKVSTDPWDNEYRFAAPASTTRTRSTCGRSAPTVRTGAPMISGIGKRRRPDSK